MVTKHLTQVYPDKSAPFIMPTVCYCKISSLILKAKLEDLKADSLELIAEITRRIKSTKELAVNGGGWYFDKWVTADWINARIAADAKGKSPSSPIS